MEIEAMRTKLRAALVRAHDEGAIDRVMRDLFWSPRRPIRRPSAVIAFRQRRPTDS